MRINWVLAHQLVLLLERSIKYCRAVLHGLYEARWLGDRHFGDELLLSLEGGTIRRLRRPSFHEWRMTPKALLWHKWQRIVQTSQTHSSRMLGGVMLVGRAQGATSFFFLVSPYEPYCGKAMNHGLGNAWRAFFKSELVFKRFTDEGAAGRDAAGHTRRTREPYCRCYGVTPLPPFAACYELSSNCPLAGLQKAAARRVELN